MNLIESGKKRALKRTIVKKTIITVVFISISLLLAMGCGSGKQGEEKTAEGDENPGGMGRYMEDIHEIPGEINRNGGLNVLADGSMAVISFNGGLYRSADQGASWQREDVPWFPMMQGV